jgi:hypothetical protein
VTAVATEVKVTDTQETKKAEKKKKQKEKQAAADAGKGASKAVSAQQPRQETEVNSPDLGGNKHDLPDDTEELFWGSPIRVQNEILPPKVFQRNMMLTKLNRSLVPYHLILIACQASVHGNNLLRVSCLRQCWKSKLRNNCVHRKD